MVCAVAFRASFYFPQTQVAAYLVLLVMATHRKVNGIYCCFVGAEIRMPAEAPE